MSSIWAHSFRNMQHNNNVKFWSLHFDLTIFLLQQIPCCIDFRRCHCCNAIWHSCMRCTINVWWRVQAEPRPGEDIRNFTNWSLLTVKKGVYNQKRQKEWWDVQSITKILMCTWVVHHQEQMHARLNMFATKRLCVYWTWQNYAEQEVCTDFLVRVIMHNNRLPLIVSHLPTHVSVEISIARS